MPLSSVDLILGGLLLANGGASLLLWRSHAALKLRTRTMLSAGSDIKASVADFAATSDKVTGILSQAREVLVEIEQKRRVIDERLGDWHRTHEELDRSLEAAKKERGRLVAALQEEMELGQERLEQSLQRLRAHRQEVAEQEKDRSAGDRPVDERCKGHDTPNPSSPRQIARLPANLTLPRALRDRARDEGAGDNTSQGFFERIVG